MMLVLYLAFRYFLFSTARLCADDYAAPVLMSSLAAAIGVPGLIALGLSAATLLKYGGLAHRWDVFEHAGTLRCFVTGLALVLAWPLATTGFNYYFDQAHTYDRAALLLLVPLLYWRPAFIFLFLALAYAIMWQFATPDLGANPVFAHKQQLLNILILFAGLFTLHAVMGTRRKDEFLFLSCCAVAAAYWFPAWTKIELNWVLHGGLYKMLPNAYAHGWLSFIEPATITKLTHLVAIFDWPMRLFVLAIEAACLFFLLRRGLSIALLGSVILFHLGVFALYGYLFWTWILLDIALAWLLIRDWRSQQIAIYSNNHLILSVILIAGASAWSQPAKLGWFDTALTYTYRYTVITDSGAKYQVSPRFFEPYGDVFTMAKFDYLNAAHKSLVHPYGITSSRERAVAIDQARNADDIFALEDSLGSAKFKPEMAARFEAFLYRYFSNYNAHSGSDSLFERFSAPPQFWSFVDGESFAGQEPVTEVIVTEVTTFYDGSSVRPIRTLEMLRVKIDKPSDNSTHDRKP